jgi:ABC-type transporter Mla maintaining outer membrane lipid asymmetry permease subunit MlaE
MDSWIAFVLGLLIGASLGVVVVALMVAAGRTGSPLTREYVGADAIPQEQDYV